MQCLGRTNQFHRCKKKAHFIVCQAHKKQAVIFLLLSIPSLALTYYGVYDNFIRPALVKKSVPEFLLTIKESVEKNELEKNITNPDFGEETGSTYTYTPKKMVDSAFTEVIQYYEDKQERKAIDKIEKLFKKKVQNDDDLLGYMVAVYFGSEKFEKAAETVLVRNQSRKRWDYSLKLDFARCIRYYSISHTLNEALELVDKLQTKYKDPIISHLWACIPFDELMPFLEEGVYSYNACHIQNEKVNAEIKFVTNKYPNDPFISYGYLLMRDYARALAGQNNRIKDICLYARGYEKIKETAKKYCREQEHDFYYYIPAKPIENADLRKEILIAINDFKGYVDLYPHRVHSDDAAFWIAWLNAFLGNYEETVTWLNRGMHLGDNDYQGINTAYRNLLINTVSNSTKIIRQLYLSSEFKDSAFSGIDEDKIKLNYAFFSTLSSAELSERIAGADKMAVYQYLYSLINKGEFISVKAIYTKLKASDINFDRNIDKKYRAIIENTINVLYVNKTAAKVIEEILRNKNVHKLRLLALNQIEYALKTYSFSNSQIEFLHYLKIRIRVIIDPGMANKDIADFLGSYPKSTYADDILAESVYLNLKVLNYPEKAFASLNTIFEKYPGGNACDNAINHLADYYLKFCDTYYKDWRENCKNAIRLNEIILFKYPESTYAPVSKERKNQCKALLSKAPD